MAAASVYVLHHVRKDDAYGDDAKLIGVYRTQDAADAAMARLLGQPGFRDFPEGFRVQRFALDKDHWTEGFVDLSDEH
ncbi:MAG: hypothetical protein IT562_08790 [Alphaproteobacteria bacterium]|nr:hypothetical protein [Alphaproteobacteria bacterium]